jgi:aspartate/methionine/tyrosine aminotransferase
LDYLAALNDIELVRYPLIYHKGWKIDGESLNAFAALNPCAVLVVHPNNPTGNFTSQEELAQINRICCQKDAAIISDEVFYEFPLKTGGRPLSFAANQDVPTFTISGISKILGIPQMKLSWIIVTGPPKTCRQAIERLEIISDTFLSVSTPIQNALESWFGQHPAIRQEILKRISENYELLVEKFGKESGIKLLEAEGGWSAILQMPGPMNDEQWALQLLDEKHIIAHPGFLFDFTEGSFLVLSLLTRSDIFREGASRLSAS